MRAESQNVDVVLALTVDSLRTADLGHERQVAGLTPNLDRLIADGLYASNVFATGCPTQFAMPGFFTSSLPLDYGGYEYGVKGRGKTLPQAMNEAGFETIGLTTSYWLSDLYDYNRGFDEFIELYDLEFYFTQLEGIYLSHYGDLVRKTGDRVALESLVRFLEHFFSSIQGFCRRKQKEQNDPGDLLLSPIFHRWNFAAALEMLQDEDDAFRSAPISYVYALSMEGRKSTLFQRFLQLKSETRTDLESLPYFLRGRLKFAMGANAIRAYAAQRGDVSGIWPIRHALSNVRLPKGDPIASAAYLVENIKRILAKPREKPVFVWTHFLDVHNFMAHTHDMMHGSTTSRDEVVAALKLQKKIRTAGLSAPTFPKRLASLRYVDAQLGNLLGFIGEAGLSDRTQFLVSADHGCSGAPLRDGHYVGTFYDELHHIPAIFAGASIPAGANRGLWSGVDLAPSLLSFAGVMIPESMQGHVITGPADPGRSSVFMENLGRGPCDFANKKALVCCRTKERKVIVSGYATGAEADVDIDAAYDLGTDSNERRNLREVANSSRSYADLIELCKGRLLDISQQVGSIVGG